MPSYINRETPTVEESFTFYLEAYNSAGSTESPSGVFNIIPGEKNDVTPLGPLTFSQFIGAIIAVILVILILLLLLFIVPGAFVKRHSAKNVFSENLATAFDSEVDKVVCDICTVIQ